MTARPDRPGMATAIRHVIGAAWEVYRFCPGSYGASMLHAALALSEAFERDRELDWCALYLDHQCGSR